VLDWVLVWHLVYLAVLTVLCLRAAGRRMNNLLCK
jgi:lipooligosaccharide transport system permease protein